jgi:hypothetical protein
VGVRLQAINKEITMLASIFILILLLPAAFLPVALDAFVSDTDLDEMGISLENSDDTFSMQGYELVGLLPVSNCDTWEISEPLQVCQ